MTSLPASLPHAFLEGLMGRGSLHLGLSHFLTGSSSRLPWSPCPPTPHPTYTLRDSRRNRKDPGTQGRAHNPARVKSAIWPSRRQRPTVLPAPRDRGRQGAESSGSMPSSSGNGPPLSGHSCGSWTPKLCLRVKGHFGELLQASGRR